MTTPATPTTATSTPAAPAPVVLEADGVSKYFEVRGTLGGGSTIHAVEDASLQLHRGEIVALVGESGSGKTTLARLLAQFYPVTSGRIKLDGSPVDPRRGFGDREFHSRVQLIFQDPFGALNPLKPVRHNLERALKLHHRFADRAELADRVLELMERVNLTPAADLVDAFPYQLSGGQRQRLVIARALAVDPQVLLADEPTSMLDVSIRLDILNLLRRLRDEHDLAMLYITHDIASARYVSNTVQVMYAGQTIEGGPTDEVIKNPQHPYTQLLLESSPDPETTLDAGAALDLGEPPDLADPPTGCRYHPRCPFAMDICKTTFPARSEISDGHWTHCWLHLQDPTRTQQTTRKPGDQQ